MKVASGRSCQIDRPWGEARQCNGCSLDEAAAAARLLPCHPNVQFKGWMGKQ